MILKRYSVPLMLILTLSIKAQTVESTESLKRRNLNEYKSSYTDQGVKSLLDQLIEQMDGFDDYVTIDRFGAKGDGVTINTTSIQKAVDYVAQTEHKNLLIPKGQYITGPINIPSGVTIIGVDNRLSKLISESDMTNIFELAGADNVTISNVYFTGKGQPSTRGGNGIRSVGRGLIGNENIVIKDCVFQDFRRSAIALFAGSDNLLVKGCDFYNIGAAAIQLANVFNSRILENYIDGTGDDAIALNGGVSENNIVAHNTIVHGGTLLKPKVEAAGIKSHGHNQIISNNTLSKCHRGIHLKADPSFENVKSGSGASFNNMISGNIISGIGVAELGSDGAIVIDEGFNIKIVDNIITAIDDGGNLGLACRLKVGGNIQSRGNHYYGGFRIATPGVGDLDFVDDQFTFLPNYPRSEISGISGAFTVSSKVTGQVRFKNCWYQGASPVFLRITTKGSINSLVIENFRFSQMAQAAFLKESMKSGSKPQKIILQDHGSGGYYKGMFANAPKGTKLRLYDRVAQVHSPVFTLKEKACRGENVLKVKFETALVQDFSPTNTILVYASPMKQQDTRRLVQVVGGKVGKLSIEESDEKGRTLVGVSGKGSVGEIRVLSKSRVKLGSGSNPNVLYGKFFDAGSEKRRIENFKGGFEGQEIVVYFTSANTTIGFSGGNIKGNKGADFKAKNGDAISCFYLGGVWRCSVLE